MKNPFLTHIKALEKKQIQIEKNFGDIVHGEVSKEIPDLIRDSLYNSGLVSKGGPVRTDNAFAQFPYARKTLKYKWKKNQKTSIVTLHDSGQFYKSFFVKKTRSAILMRAKFHKRGEHISDNFGRSFRSDSDFERDVLSLPDETLRMLIKKKIQPALVRRLRY